jgi:hypothetical protein
MTNIPTKSAGPAPAPIDPAEHDALLAGLAQVKRQGLTIKYGPRTGDKTVRVQLQMTALEHKMMQTMRHVAGFTVGRPISSVLLMRVGLRALMKACTAALKDPVAAEKLRQDILRAREERLSDGRAIDL